MICLEPLNGTASHRTKNAVNRPLIVPLVGERSLYFQGYVAGRDVAVSVDRPVVNVPAVVRIVAVGGIPPAIVPIPVATSVKDEWETLRYPPPVVMTLMPIPLTSGVERSVVVTSDDRESAIPARFHDNVVTPVDVNLIVLLHHVRRLSPVYMLAV